MGWGIYYVCEQSGRGLFLDTLCLPQLSVQSGLQRRKYAVALQQNITGLM